MPKKIWFSRESTIKRVHGRHGNLCPNDMEIESIRPRQRGTVPLPFCFAGPSECPFFENQHPLKLETQVVFIESHGCALRAIQVLQTASEKCERVIFHAPIVHDALFMFKHATDACATYADVLSQLSMNAPAKIIHINCAFRIPNDDVRSAVAFWRWCGRFAVGPPINFTVPRLSPSRLVGGMRTWDEWAESPGWHTATRVTGAFLDDCDDPFILFKDEAWPQRRLEFPMTIVDAALRDLPDVSGATQIVFLDAGFAFHEFHLLRCLRAMGRIPNVTRAIIHERYFLTDHFVFQKWSSAQILEKWREWTAGHFGDLDVFACGSHDGLMRLVGDRKSIVVMINGWLFTPNHRCDFWAWCSTHAINPPVNFLDGLTHSFDGWVCDHAIDRVRGERVASWIERDVTVRLSDGAEKKRQCAKSSDHGSGRDAGTGPAPTGNHGPRGEKYD